PARVRRDVRPRASLRLRKDPRVAAAARGLTGQLVPAAFPRRRRAVGRAPAATGRSAVSDLAATPVRALPPTTPAPYPRRRRAAGRATPTPRPCAASGLARTPVCALSLSRRATFPRHHRAAGGAAILRFAVSCPARTPADAFPPTTPAAFPRRVCGGLRRRCRVGGGCAD